jgi:transposase-like protein
MARSQRDPERERRWRAVVSAWAASGLTVSEYCRRHRVAESSFYAWRRASRDAASSSPPIVAPASPRFVPVTVVPAATVAVEVRCPSGHVVTLPSCDASGLATLFAALAPLASEGSPC